MSRVPGRHRLLLGWLVLLLCVAVGGAAGLLVHDRLPRSYEASTSVLVLPTAAALTSDVNGPAAGGAVDIDTEVQLAGSALVAQAAAEQLDGRISATRLQSGTDVTVPSNSTVLEITVRAPEAQLAADAATALSTAYLDRRGAQADAEVAGAVAALQTQVERLQASLQEITAGLGAFAESDVSGRALAESERTVVVAQLADVNSRLVALQAGTAPGGEVITAPEVPASATWPSLPVSVGAGLLAGALVGGLLALLLGRDRGLRSAALRRNAVLRDLGTLDLDDVDLVRDPATGEPADADAAVPTAVSALVSRVDRFRGGHDGPEVLLVVAPPDVARRLPVVLGTAWAQDRGDNVLVVAQPDAPQPTDVPADGLSEVLLGAAPAADVLDPASVPGVTLLGPGRRRAGLPPAVVRTRLASLWSELRQGERGVLVVLVPPLHTAEAQGVLRTAGRIVVAVHPRADEDVVAGVYEDVDFLGLSDRLVGTVTVHAVDRDALVRGER